MLRQVTVVPAVTVIAIGVKSKFFITMVLGASAAAICVGAMARGHRRCAKRRCQQGSVIIL